MHPHTLCIPRLPAVRRPPHRPLSHRLCRLLWWILRERKRLRKAAEQLQRKLTSAIQEAAFDRLIASAQSATDAVRAVNCSLNGATLFNHIRPLERALELKDFAWRSAIRHKYGLPPVYASNRVAVCVCGQIIGTGHNHSCNRALGPATTERHDMVVGCL